MAEKAITVTITGEPLRPGERMVTVTEHHRLAMEIIADLEAIDAKIQKLERAVFEPEDFIRAHVNVPVAFMRSTVALVEERPDLQAVKRLDPEEGRGTLDYLANFVTVADRASALTERLKLNLKSRKARLAWQCLHIYALAKNFIRDGKDVDLATRVELLGRDLGPRGRPRKPRNG